MSDNMDRRLIGRYVEHEVEARTSWTKFAAVSGVSRATLYRIKDGDPIVEERTLRRVERGLDLPYDTLANVGAHNFDALEVDGMAPAIVAWLRRAAEQAPDLSEHVTRKASPEAQEKIRAARAAAVAKRRRSAQPNGH